MCVMCIYVLYNQNYWRPLYSAIYSKIAIDRILNWQVCVLLGKKLMVIV